jgi:hypothetical protein
MLRALDAISVALPRAANQRVDRNDESRPPAAAGARAAAG